MTEAATLLPPETVAETITDALPVVVVGNGPAGMRVARELLRRLPAQSLIVYGDEQQQPYNRVRLSSWLAGEVTWESLLQPLERPAGSLIEECLGYRITHIDREQRCVIDDSGRCQPYSKLILATGSRPFVPGIPGIDVEGVFTFRDVSDAERLIARRARSHRTVVLGGGLLGLEAARGMQPGNTQVTVVEHADRLLGRQLDEGASLQLQEAVEGFGLRVIVGDGVAKVLGSPRLQGVMLQSGEVLPCDTLIVATGIRPNIQLARAAHLAYGRGIQVDDRMRTSDPDIYAVGECVEHHGKVYDLVAPGFEQAGVAAADIAGIDSHYAGSIAASRLKVVGTQVFSMGPVGVDAKRHYGRTYAYRDDASGIYRKLMTMLSTAVNGLDNLDKLIEPLKNLGAKHKDYGVNADDYNKVADAFLWTMSQGLGDAFTEEVKASWVVTYTTVASVMIEGAAYSTEAETA